MNLCFLWIKLCRWLKCYHHHVCWAVSKKVDDENFVRVMLLGVCLPYLPNLISKSQNAWNFTPMSLGLNSFQTNYIETCFQQSFDPSSWKLIVKTRKRIGWINVTDDFWLFYLNLLLKSKGESLISQEKKTTPEKQTCFWSPGKRR